MSLRKIRDLAPIETRLLGALLEKEKTTPEYYPLTVSALLAACNQKTGRDPVTSLTETEVVEALDSLRGDALAWRSEGSRAERWSQMVSRRLELDAEERAVLTLLLLRGPQTPGELRARSGRLHDFTDLGQIEAALRRLASPDRDLAVEVPRRPGQKETRWMHRLEGEAAVGGPAAAPAAECPPDIAASKTGSADGDAADLAARLARLERRVDELAAAVERLAR